MADDFFTYSEITPEGNVVEVSHEELKIRARNAFFEWFEAVRKLVGWTTEEAGNKLSDPSWFFCYDDGLTPEDAVSEAKRQGIVQSGDSHES